MNAKALVLAAVLAVPLPVPADDAPATAPGDGCLMLNNRILGPRSADRPLPLLRGDPAHGFTPACTRPWSALSPNNEPLAVDGCFRGSLLQIANDRACGAGTGKLWIGSRWVVTSADLAQRKERAAVCQQLETGAWAGTRAFSFECEPRTREVDAVKDEAKPAAPQPAAAQPAAAQHVTTSPPKDPP